MAGTKSPKTLVDKLKKRKREVHDADPKSKRQRAADDEAAGGNAGAKEANGQLAKANGTTAAVISKDQQLQLTPGSGSDEAGWKVSKPMGGRIMDIDPIFTADEQ
jgi:NET1-associated nuclear protein 1 (U3 small nucleolar RNA-associated protein 17)